MKAVLIILAAMILLTICSVTVVAAEPELSVDYFFGEGDLTCDPTEKEESESPYLTSKMIVIPEDPDDPDDPEDPDDPNDPDDPEPNPNKPLKLRPDLKGVILGLRYPIGRFRPALELGSGKEKESGWKEDFKFMELKAGYALSEGEKGRIEPYLSYLNLEAGGFDAEGIMLGVDFRYRLASRFSLDGGIGFSVDPNLEKEKNSYHDETLNLGRVKLVYHLNDRWDLGLGYRIYRFDGEASEGPFRKVDAEYAFTTLGFTVKFGAKPKLEPAPIMETQPEPIPEPASPQPGPAAEPEPEPIPETEPEMVPLIPVPEVYRLLQPIFFDFDIHELREDQRSVLDENIIILKDYPGLYILVGGHADHHGSVDYNVALSERRAKTVKDYMVQKGIDSQRITIYSYGESYPYDKYDVNSNWESDRWVDILVFELPPSWEMGIDNRGTIFELK